MKEMNPEYIFNLATDIECEKFIKDNFDYNIYDAYMSINPKYGAAKADFWRYCIIYKKGGIYLDLDSYVKIPFSEWINESDEVLLDFENWADFPVNKDAYTGFANADKIQKILGYTGKTEVENCIKSFGKNKQLRQNCIIYTPEHPMLLEVINEVVNNINIWKSVSDESSIPNSISKTVHITGPSAYTRAVSRYISKNKEKCNFRIAGADFVQFRNENTNNMYENNPNDYHHMNNKSFILKNTKEEQDINHCNIKNKEETIPKIVWQTYNDKDSIPQKVLDNIKKYCKGYTHNVYQDSQCKTILSIFGEKYVKAFDNLKIEEHKSALWIYACMYLMGGVYLDIKIELVKHLDEIITRNDHLYTCLCQNGIFNGFIATPPKNDIFLSLMDTMVQFSETDQKMYFVTIMDFYNKISERMLNTTDPYTPCVCPGMYDHLKLTLFYNDNNRSQLSCDKTDRSELVYKGHNHTGEHIFNTLYPDFPLKKTSIVTFNLQNIKVSLYRNDCYITQSFNTGVYWDIDTLQKLKKYIDPVKNILEIGGHCGTSSLMYSKYVDNNSKIFVYEPQKNMYNLLKRNIDQNNLQEKIIPYNNCLFCDEIEIEMNDTDLDGNKGSKIKDMYVEGKPCNFGGTCLGKGGEKVKSVVLDKITHENIGFIHCDAHGAENFIFAGGKDFIKKHRPVIFYENNCKYPESKYLYDNVCKYYPEYEKESKFNLEKYCIEELGYEKVISNFSGVDDLLIP